MKLVLQKMLCLVIGHDTMTTIRDQPNDKVVKYDLICERCKTVTGTLTWPNLNFGRHREG